MVLETAEINERWERPLLQFVLKKRAHKEKTSGQLYLIVENPYKYLSGFW